MKPDQSDIYQQLIQQPFIQSYIKEFEGIYPFNENSFKIEIWDDIGQCSVWLGFEDQFAIRDAFGNWSEASAEECIMLRDGSLVGTMN
ncbi:hypothetical protein PB16LOC_00999 [Pectobacterium versatile]|uniref:hypothetical protein n=1 Tax=Pectobacterium versatile TaxID=2488639 RepID=UPI000F8DBFC0|nr:hypothetical protein [Pectobacterium versatile]RUR94702.1 hypothetical protein PB16LOC_00999 [Pectobacterium versatile]